MRTLIVGAGGTGGAFGKRLIDAGRDITFLVRERRLAQLTANGLTFRDPSGESTTPVTAVTSIAADTEPFDLILITVKAPALPAVIESIRPAVGPHTRILPILNGLDHIDRLSAAYPGQVLGGLAKIVATIDDSATVVQMTPLSSVTIGTLDGTQVDSKIVDNLSVDGLKLVVADNMLTRLWEKWAFIASAGVICCLFRANIGAILAAGGREAMEAAIAETERVAAAAGHPVSEQAHAMSTGMLLEEGSQFTSSLYRDLMAGDAAEAEHILGAMSERGRQLGVGTPLVDLTLIQIRAGGGSGI